MDNLLSIATFFCRLIDTFADYLTNRVKLNGRESRADLIQVIGRRCDDDVDGRAGKPQISGEAASREKSRADVAMKMLQSSKAAAARNAAPVSSGSPIKRGALAASKDSARRSTRQATDGGGDAATRAEEEIDSKDNIVLQDEEEDELSEGEDVMLHTYEYKGESRSLRIRRLEDHQMVTLSKRDELNHVEYHPDLLEKAKKGIDGDRKKVIDPRQFARNLITLCWPMDPKDRKDLLDDGHGDAIAGKRLMLNLCGDYT